MALSASTIWEIRTGGSDTNGGGYVSGGTDWSLQDAAQYSVTDAVTNGTTTITSATANFGTDVVGNILYIQGGTAPITAGWYQIISRTNSTTIVVDRSTGLTTGTGATLKIGGALATPGGLGAIIAVVGGQGVAGMKAYIKAGTYTLSGSTVNTSGGPLDLNISGMQRKRFRLEGYNSTRGDLGTKPIIDAGAQTSINVIKLGAAYGGRQQHVINLEIDGNDNSSVIGIYIAGIGSYPADAVAYKCYVHDCPTGFYFDKIQLALQCIAESCGTVGFSVNLASGCVAKNGAIGFQNTLTFGDWLYTRCIAHGNTGDGWKIASNGCGMNLQRCTAYDNDGDGFDVDSAAGSLEDACMIEGCLAVSNGLYGFQIDSTRFRIQMKDNAAYNNTSGTRSQTPDFDINFITLTGDPFVDGAGGDFRPNSTAGAGAAIRGQVSGCVGQTDNLDIGAVQHSDPAGGGVIIVEDD